MTDDRKRPFQYSLEWLLLLLTVSGPFLWLLYQGGWIFVWGFALLVVYIAFWVVSLWLLIFVASKIAGFLMRAFSRSRENETGAPASQTSDDIP
jgi:Zn-dependent protease with chaperone function